MENPNRELESTRQELASRLVQREVVCCVSSLMSGILQLSQLVSYKDMQDALGTDSDELSELFQRPDYEEAARQFIMDDADLSQLEEVADTNGYWGDVLIDSDVPAGLDDIDEYIEAHPEKHGVIRANVWELVNTDEEFQWVCNEYNLDTDQIEVYEHYAISDWLGRKLAEKGEIVGEFCNLTVWGRCCTGQSISMDSVVCEITRELWPEEWAGEKAL